MGAYVCKMATLPRSLGACMIKAYPASTLVVSGCLDAGHDPERDQFSDSDVYRRDLRLPMQAWAYESRIRELWKNATVAKHEAIIFFALVQDTNRLRDETLLTWCHSGRGRAGVGGAAEIGKRLCGRFRRSCSESCSCLALSSLRYPWQPVAAPSSVLAQSFPSTRTSLVSLVSDGLDFRRGYSVDPWKSLAVTQ